tara:strand:- start:4133 stop:4918 length:786 start_codon:yes stop_codon:yes gene_type:complete
MTFTPSTPSTPQHMQPLPFQGVVGVRVLNPGRGYLAAPNGSTGGQGRTWSQPNSTIIRRNTLLWEIPANPGRQVCVNPGDMVRLPAGTTVVTEPNEEEIIGPNPHIVEFVGCFTTPSLPADSVVRGSYPTSDSSYPVILYLCEIYVNASGVRYREGDEVVIEPSMGATASIKVNDMGGIVSVKVTSGGEGFVQRPKVYVRSATGFNTDLIPRFCIDRISNDEIKEPTMQDKIISVVDCVGKVPASIYDAPCSTCNDTSMVW